MPVDTTGLPDAVQAKIADLSRDINFEKISSRGANGYVLFGHNTLLDRPIAVKFYYWGSGDHIEPALLARLQSDFILPIFHAESIDTDDAFFTMPYCALGDLDDAICRKKYGPLEAIDIIKDVIAGVSYLHGSGYLHRDLKPSNILCRTENHFVIGDFGSVVPQNDKGYATTLTRHSLIYRPPEEIETKNFHRQSDLYQIGIVFYQLLGGYFPYEVEKWLNLKQIAVYNGLDFQNKQSYSTDIIEKKICSGKILNFESLPPWTPVRLISIIKQCCSKEIQRRFTTASDLLTYINNIRDNIPDWRIDQHPTLHRTNKKIRIIQTNNAIGLEKFVTDSWRKERRYNPKTMKDAVAVAEPI